MSASTFSALIRDATTGRTRGVSLVIDGARVRLQLDPTPTTGATSADISDMRAAVVAALTERKDENERR